MTCDELEHFLLAYLDDEFELEERLDVEAHLAGCPQCANRVHDEKRFLTSFKQRARNELNPTAPSGLQDRLRNGVRQERRKDVQRIWLRMSAAAAVALALGGSVWQYQRYAVKKRYLEAAALRHARSHPLEVSQLPHEGVEAWFGGKLDHHVRVPRLSNVQLAGARLSHVEDRQAAYIRYEAATEGGGNLRRPVSLFVFDDAARDVRADPLPQIAVDSANGYNVAIWRDGEIVYELVTDLDEADIRRMLSESHSNPRALPAAAPSRPNLPIQPAGFRQ